MFSRKDSYGRKVLFKYFIGYKNETDAFPVSLFIKCSQINGLVKYFDSNKKYMNRFSHDIKKY